MPLMQPLTADTSKRVFFVRHGHGEHNAAMDRGREDGIPPEVTMQNVKIRDPALTPLGKEQAQKLISDPVLARALVAGTGRAEAVVVSPLQRTLQTAVIGLGAGTGSAGLSDVKFIAQPDCQEVHNLPADTGRPVSALRPEFPGVDFAEVFFEDTWFKKPAIWDFKTMSPNAEGQAAMRETCARFTAWLAARKEKVLVVVAHHTFLVHLLGLEFANCEVMELELFHESRTYRVLTARAEPTISTKGGRNRGWMGRSPIWSTCDKDDHDAARIQEGPTMPVWYAPVNKHGYVAQRFGAPADMTAKL